MPSMTHSSSQTDVIMCSSWLMTNRPPSNFDRAIINASTVSKSRWFVGSSSSSMCGRVYVIMASATRLFWPPDSDFTGWTCSLPVMPREERCPRILGIGSLGWCSLKISSADLLYCSCSTWCWLKRPMLMLLRTTVPAVGSMSPWMSLSRVDFPTPLGPTRQMRLSIDSWKSTPRRIGSLPLG
mmetsp:Transcript_10802/g.27305  ORF Transcript_10802/g.27305 Transcript_10802/m.27305 type:complete len:183 (-) Transcript_10802:172-720(-)